MIRAGALLFGLTGLALWPPAALAGSADPETAGWYSIETIVFQRLAASGAGSGERLTRTDRRSFPRGIRAFSTDLAGIGYRLDPLARATLEFPTLSFACPPPGGPATIRPTSVPAWYRTGVPATGRQPADSAPDAALPGSRNAASSRRSRHSEPVGSDAAVAGNAGLPAPVDAPSPSAPFMGPSARFCSPETPAGTPAAATGGTGCVPAPLDVPLPPARSAPVCSEPPGVPAPAIAPVLEPHPLLDRLRAVRDFKDSLLQASYQASTRGARLSRQARRIDNAPGLRLLWHGRWTQRVPTRSAAEPLLIQAGREWRDGYELEGTFDITRGRFLHFHARLWLRAFEESGADRDSTEDPGGGSAAQAQASADAGAPAPGNPPGNPQGYMALDESRAMRAATLHYLDHPRFGVLVRADRLPMPDWLADASAATLPAEPGN